MNIQSLPNPDLAFFNLNSSEIKTIEKYLSPANESSVVKGVPLNLLENMKNIVRRATDQKIRVMYRGPRYDSMRCYCKKEDAKSFAVYIK